MRFYRNILLFFITATAFIQIFVHSQQDLNVPLAINYGKAADDASSPYTATSSRHITPVSSGKYNHGLTYVCILHIKQGRRKSEGNIIFHVKTEYVFRENTPVLYTRQYEPIRDIDGLNGYLVHFMRC